MTANQQRSELHRNFDRAEQALRANLRLLGGGQQARAHTERALSHTLEAHIATNDRGSARTVAQLVADLEKLERLFGNITCQPRHKFVARHD
jgi:hypothetical protein